jgi:hypothetical protein
VITKEISKQAGSLLNTIKKGIINVPEIIGILQKVESQGSTSVKPKKRQSKFETELMK